MRSLRHAQETKAYRADHVCPRVSAREPGRIFIKFGTEIMPLETTPDS
jgi:hypothetical protein